jgi:uncharacterized protein (DUF2235 family)
MPKNIVLCLDGTGNQLKAKGNTNVVLLYQMLDLSDPSRQVAYYDPGVGTFSARGAWTTIARKLSRLLGLAFGTGIKENLGEAYTYLMHHYEPGDRVYVLGFSRGAFTARGLAGVTYRAGLMRPGAENLVDYLVSAYTKGDRFTDEDWEVMSQFGDTFAHETDGSKAMPIHFLGLWDSVKALGWFRWDPKWPFTRKLPNARTIRHAVSIDEKRRPYAEYTVEPTEKSELSEAWFAGVHSDVGGTFVDDDRLSRIALKWMVDGALEAGLLVEPRAYAKRCTVGAADATAPVHRMGRIWALLTYRRRPVPPGTVIHASVRDRLAADPGYGLPEPVEAYTWADEDWTTPAPMDRG